MRHRQAGVVAGPCQSGNVALTVAIAGTSRLVMYCSYAQPGEQHRAVPGVGTGQVGQGRLEEGHRLGVRAGAGGLLGRRLRVASGPRCVGGGHRVVGQHRGVLRLHGLEGPEEPGVQAGRPPGGDRALDGEAGQLVAEDQPAALAHEQTGAVQPAQRREVDAERRQHPVVEAVGGARRELEHLEVLRGDARGAGEDRVAHGRRAGGGPGPWRPP